MAQTDHAGLHLVLHVVLFSGELSCGARSRQRRAGRDYLGQPAQPLAEPDLVVKPIGQIDVARVVDSAQSSTGPRLSSEAAPLTLRVAEAHKGARRQQACAMVQYAFFIMLDMHMLTRLGEARDSSVDGRPAWSLAGIAGALNTASFYAAGLYASNMTGNVSALADHLAVGDVDVASKYLALVMTFISGAAASAVLINVGRRGRIAGIYAFSILAEAVLLTVLACADLWLTGPARGALLAYGLSFLMGLQNAVVTRISNARVRTTHVTGMVTDIGIELGNLLDLAIHRRSQDEPGRTAAYNGDKLRLHGLTVLSFLCGGVFGVLAYRRFGPLFLFGAALLLLTLALPGVFGRRAPSPPRDEG